MKPTITEHDAITGETVGREMTDDEYAALIAAGWTLEPQEETPEE